MRRRYYRRAAGLILVLTEFIMHPSLEFIMPRSRPLEWRKSNEVARARRTISREGVDIETRSFSFTPRGKCTRAASRDSFLTSRDNRPDYCSSATAAAVSAQREFFYPFLGTIRRAAPVCDLTYDVSRVADHFARVCNDHASSARDILTHHRRNRFHTIYNFVSMHFTYSERE